MFTTVAIVVYMTLLLMCLTTSTGAAVSFHIRESTFDWTPPQSRAFAANGATTVQFSETFEISYNSTERCTAHAMTNPTTGEVLEDARCFFEFQIPMYIHPKAQLPFLRATNCSVFDVSLINLNTPQKRFIKRHTPRSTLPQMQQRPPRQNNMTQSTMC